MSRLVRRCFSKGQGGLSVLLEKKNSSIWTFWKCIVADVTIVTSLFALLDKLWSSNFCWLIGLLFTLKEVFYGDGSFVPQLLTNILNWQFHRTLNRRIFYITLRVWRCRGKRLRIFINTSLISAGSTRVYSVVI